MTTLVSELRKEAKVIIQEPGDGGGIPLIDPATDGNLVVQNADGTLRDAGYAPSTIGLELLQVENEANGRDAIGAAASAGAGSSGEVATIDSNGNAVRSGLTVEVNLNTGASIPARSASGTLNNTANDAINAAISGISGGGASSAGVQGIGLSGTPGIKGYTLDGGYPALFGAGVHPHLSAIHPDTGALVFLGASAAANRNACLRGLFQSLPTADPLIAGDLWNDGGAVKISNG